MAQIELIMPKMGESIMEATILKWVKKEGDVVEADETILEIATDKVDSEVPSPVSGTIAKILFKEEDVVAIGTVIAVIATEGEEVVATPSPAVAESPQPAPAKEEAPVASTPAPQNSTPANTPIPSATQAIPASGNGNRFYSPLVRTIAKKENIGIAELETVSGQWHARSGYEKRHPGLLKKQRQRTETGGSTKSDSYHATCSSANQWYCIYEWQYRNCRNGPHAPADR